MTTLFTAADVAYAFCWLALGAVILMGVLLLIAAWVREAWRAFKAWNHRRRMRNAVERVVTLAEHLKATPTASNTPDMSFRRSMGAK